MNDRLAIVNATAIVADDAATVVRDATLIVAADGAIRSLGRGAASHDAVEVIDARGGIILPGLINAHTHLAMTLFRGLADDVRLEDFLARLMPAEFAVLSPEAVAAGTRLAALESLRGGITTALDMYYLPESIVEVAHDTKMRIHTGPTLLEFDGPERLGFDARLEWSKRWLDRARLANDSASLWLGPHSTYLMGEDHLRRTASLAAEFGARIHVHAAETVGEMRQVAERHDGKSPIDVLRDTDLLQNAVLAHGVHLSDGDIAAIAEAGATVVHCPASNYKLASGFARIVDLMRAGVNVALGTDGPASGNDLDLWLAMRLAGYGQKNLASDPTVLPAHSIVQMATRNGARALGIEHLVGSLEVGKRADVIVLDADSPALTPAFDPHVAVVAAAGRGDVQHVIIDGEVVVRDRTPLTIDVASTLQTAQRFAETVRSSVGQA
jgi:5-methylthioadenosine/S-adenosylhomocysteine deaminase